MIHVEKQKPLIQFIFFFLLFFILVFFIPKVVTGNPGTILNDRLSTFATVFLGIFIEAAPFLFLGTLASGVIEVFLDRDAMVKIMPKQALLSALIGSCLGLVFPVCDCGVIPLTRRLFRKGFPIPAGIAFLLSAPILNPIVIVSTATAFGIGRILFLRIGVSMAIAIITGLIFSSVQTPWEILNPTPWITVEDVTGHETDHHDSFWERIRQSFLISTDEFFEIGRYLIIGSMIAAGMQTFIPQSALLNIGKGPLLSVVIMVALAIILSICSTVDAFVALGFSSVFSVGSILAFLVFGPMIDIKTTLLLFRVFRKKTVLYLILIPLLLSILTGLIINFYIPS